MSAHTQIASVDAKPEEGQSFSKFNPWDSGTAALPPAVQGIHAFCQARVISVVVDQR